MTSQLTLYVHCTMSDYVGCSGSLVVFVTGCSVRVFLSGCTGYNNSGYSVVAAWLYNWVSQIVATTIVGTLGGFCVWVQCLTMLGAVAAQPA